MFPLYDVGISQIFKLFLSDVNQRLVAKIFPADLRSIYQRKSAQSAGTPIGFYIKKKDI